MIRTMLVTHNGKAGQLTTARNATTGMAFEATDENSMVKVRFEDDGSMTVTTGELVGGEWVTTNHIVQDGPRRAAPGIPHSVRKHHVAEGRAG